MTGRFGDTSNSAKPTVVRHSGSAYVAIDLGTNSCRMLVAVPSEGGFHVVDGFSKVVRLGERVAETGRLLPAAVDRTLDALDRRLSCRRDRSLSSRRGLGSVY